MRHADGGSGGGGGATPSLQGGSREAPGSSAMLLGIRKRRSTVHWPELLHQRLPALHVEFDGTWLITCS